MTIKYLFVLNLILEDGDERINAIENFIKNTSENDYYPPIDTYILKGAQITGISAWSSLKDSEYMSVMKLLDKDKSFLWELVMWGEFAEQYKENSKDSYAEYIKNKANNIVF